MSAITEFAEKYEKQIREWLDEKAKVRDMLTKAGAPVPKTNPISFENKIGAVVEHGGGSGVPYTQGTLYTDRREFYLAPKDQFQAAYGIDVCTPLYSPYTTHQERERLRQEKMAEYMRQMQSTAVFGTPYRVEYKPIDQDEATQEILDNILTVPTDQAIESMRQTIENM